MGWKHGTISNQLYRPEASLTGGEATPADKNNRKRIYVSDCVCVDSFNMQ
jgi:hypothetical protein